MRRFNGHETQASSSGFTLIEVLVTVALLAVVLRLGVPGFQSFLQNSRMTSASSAIMIDIQSARSNAARLNATVTLCGSSNGTTCSGVWSAGRIMFVDADSSGGISGTESLLRRSDAPTGQTITTTGISTPGILRFFPTGQPQSSGSMKLCDQRVGNYGKSLAISNTGRPSISAASCP